MRKPSTPQSDPPESVATGVGLERIIWRLAAALSGTLVAIGVLVSVIVAQRASDQSKAACGIYRGVASAPLTPATTTFGLQISAETRKAYYRARCNQGPLPPADERIYSYLPPKLRH